MRFTFGVGTSMFVFALTVQDGLHADALVGGLAFVPLAAVFVVGSVVSPKIINLLVNGIGRWATTSVHERASDFAGGSRPLEPSPRLLRGRVSAPSRLWATRSATSAARWSPGSRARWRAAPLGDRHLGPEVHRHLGSLVHVTARAVVRLMSLS